MRFCLNYYALYLLPEQGDGLLVVFRAEYGRARDEDVRPGGVYLGRVVRLYAAVHLHQDAQAAPVYLAPGGRYLPCAVLYELLAAEARVDRHDEHHVHVFPDPVERAYRG